MSNIKKIVKEMEMVKEDHIVLDDKEEDEEEDVLDFLPEIVPRLVRTCGFLKSCEGTSPCGSSRCYLYYKEK